MDVRCRQALVLLGMCLVVAGCRSAPPPTPAPTPTVTAQPTATAQPATAQPATAQPTWPDGVLFYELEEPEQACLGYQEFQSFNDSVTQIKIICTQEGVETVYFIDTEKQTVTVVRIPIPLTNKPQE